MTEQELRRLVRDAIARHGAVPSTAVNAPVPAAVRLHVSHAQFALPTGGDTDGPCIIEPAVMCTHCGYCTSLGH